MGSILIGALLQSGAVLPEQLIVANRTPTKALQLAEQYPGLYVAKSNREVMRDCDTVFLCIKPMQFKEVVEEIRDESTPDKMIISITSPVLIRHLESHLTGKIAKIIPSITNCVREGAVLCIYGTRFTIDDRHQVEQIMSHIGKPVLTPEDDVRIASDISSCGPAFLAHIIQQWIDAAVTMTGLHQDQAAELAAEMVLGTGKLLTSGQYTPEQLQSKVAVPGGITAEGLNLLERELRGLFPQLIRITHVKYEEDVQKLNEQFGPS